MLSIPLFTTFLLASCAWAAPAVPGGTGLESCGTNEISTLYAQAFKEGKGNKAKLVLELDTTTNIANPMGYLYAYESKTQEQIDEVTFGICEGTGLNISCPIFPSTFYWVVEFDTQGANLTEIDLSVDIFEGGSTQVMCMYGGATKNKKGRYLQQRKGRQQLALDIQIEI